MTAVRLDSVSFSRSDASPIFDRVSLDLAPGLTGVVGANGAGKTTLLRLVARELLPTGGTIRLEPADARVVLCSQELDEPSDAIRELRARTDGEARAWIGRLGADLDAVDRWSTLSPGERRRIQLAAAFSASPDVLLLDEPTNHVDEATRAEVVRALRRFRGIGVVVSHDRALLDELATTTVRVLHARIETIAAPYSVAKLVWEQARENAIEERRALAAEVRVAREGLADARRSRDAVDRARRVKMKGPRDHDGRGALRKGKTAAAEAKAGRIVAVRRAEVERVEARLASSSFEKEVGAAIEAAFVPTRRSVLAKLTEPAIVRGSRVVLRVLHAIVRSDTRARIVGPNGAGKTTLLEALHAEASRVERVLHLPQELDPTSSRKLLDEVRLLPSDERGHVLAIVAALGVDPARLLVSARPSPGEARKLALALGIGRGSVALFLDEPTNHLDLPSIDRLEAALARYPGALVVVSHDPVLARAATDETWLVEGGRVRTASH